MKQQELNPETRSIVCIHEAAHAIVNSMSGFKVYTLAVAPAGSKSWTYIGRKSGMVEDVWGMCSASDPVVGILLKVTAGLAPIEKRKYVEDTFRKVGSGMLSEVRKETAAHICGLLAGVAAEELLDAQTEDVYEPTEIPGHDIDKALDLTSILPGFLASHAALYELTVKTLNSPEIWGQLMGLADALEQAGMLTEDELEVLLPAPSPAWLKKVAAIAVAVPKK
jgi:hypothetical protein